MPRSTVRARSSSANTTSAKQSLPYLLMPGHGATAFSAAQAPVAWVLLRHRPPGYLRQRQQVPVAQSSDLFAEVDDVASDQAEVDSVMPERIGRTMLKDGCVALVSPLQLGNQRLELPLKFWAQL